MADEDLTKLKIDKSTPSLRPRKGRKAFYITGLAVLILLVMLFLTGIFAPAIRVETGSVALVYPSQVVTLLNASGYVVPQRKAAAASKVTGRLVALYVEEGSKVKRGQVIAQLENDDITASRKQALANLDVSRSSLEQAKAELKDAEMSFDRERRLLEKEFTTQASYDAAEARYKKAAAAAASAGAAIQASAAALRGADVALEYTYIRAPFDAVVLTKNADIGDIVTPLGAAANAKAAVVTIADMSSLQVEADVSESNIERLKVGQPCEIQLDAFPDARFAAAVHMIVPTADRSKATVMVKVKFVDRDERVLPEMSAKVAFLSRPLGVEEKRPRTALSQKALVKRNGRTAVFVVKEGRVIETPVETGERIGDAIEVKSGVKAGDKVVISPPKTLRNNARIRLAEQ
ncbi:MAG TPA: efflux RND transporter periplasmic adaptor subunit [Syntrophorhabdaceae bacterium]|nr:efflux RND transporter periplasmic adaptor subunit [Syntrophorhabdaceae bacterium]HQM80666.1 efflux RND transporter periplasmic adaptor subunit [Syntrophorhabdaceae bacterium]